MSIEILLADYKSKVHGSDIVNLLDCYSKDPMGEEAFLYPILLRIIWSRNYQISPKLLVCSVTLIRNCRINKLL